MLEEAFVSLQPSNAQRLSSSSKLLFIPSPDMPSQPPLFRFANLPVELQREILWMSALENTRDAIELVRVSRKAYHWCVRE